MKIAGVLPPLSLLVTIGCLTILLAEQRTPVTTTRPILHVAADVGGIRAVDSRGRQLAIIRGKGLQLLGWSPNGDRFAYCNGRSCSCQKPARPRHCLFRAVSKGGLRWMAVALVTRRGTAGPDDRRSALAGRS